MSDIRFDFAALDECQERAAFENFQRSPFLKQAVPFLAENVAFNIEFLHHMPFADPEKKTAIRVLAVDAMSHVVVASRVGFWGAIPQSIAILRGAIEAVTVLTSVVFHKKYKTAILEINRRLDKTAFESAAKSLDSLGGNIKKLYGRMSNLGTHATAQRFRNSEYEFEGEKYDRIGCAIEPESVEVAIYYAMHSCVLVTEVLHVSVEQESIPFPKEAEYTSLVDRFNSFCDDVKNSAKTASS